MSRGRLRTHCVGLLALLVVACAPAFRPRDFANPEALFRGSLKEFERGKWANAIIGFERLTIDLSARDTLLPRAYYYLARSHEEQEEFLLAAQAYARISDGFPNDTLAPVALFGEARAYQRLWRRPTLDPEYGLKAMSTYRILLSAFPDAPQTAAAAQQIVEIEDWLARKDYETGVHYYRTRKAYDSALLYLQDVVETYPEAPTARRAWLLMREIYEKRGWREEATETCVTLRERYPEDATVREVCPLAPAPVAGAAASDSLAG